MKLNPWQAKFPYDAIPEFDLTRFNVAHWQKYERMLAYAREKDMIISVIFFIAAQDLNLPFTEDGEDENRYYRYAVNRLAAFSNVTWDIGNEHDFHRDKMWTDFMGDRIKNDMDPYKHLLSAHNVIYKGNTLGGWHDMQLIQKWDDGLNQYFLERREEGEQAGKVKPLINEEYGYEDLWEGTKGQRSAETRRRCAWEMAMAGAYQTTGETALRGVGSNEDTGGGWIAGRGDDSMTLLKGHFPLLNCFTSLEWWKLEPANALIDSYMPTVKHVNYYTHHGELVEIKEAFCSAEQGKVYVFYLPAGGQLKATIEHGSYQVQRLNPRSGEKDSLDPFSGDSWHVDETPDHEDWVYILQSISK